MKVRGLIYGFDELRRQIVSGVKKRADELMSAIWFLTTPKGYLLHSYYIFRNLEPLGTEVKNVA